MKGGLYFMDKKEGHCNSVERDKQKNWRGIRIGTKYLMYKILGIGQVTVV
jgi:hypothetical protein